MRLTKMQLSRKKSIRVNYAKTIKNSGKRTQDRLAKRQKQSRDAFVDTNETIFYETHSLYKFGCTGKWWLFDEQQPWDNGLEWYQLKYKRVDNNFDIKYLHLDAHGDVYPFNYCDPTTFSNVHTIFATDCNKNFVYYWLNRRCFPNLRTLYLMSHPCEPHVLNQKYVTVVLGDTWEGYKKTWDWNNHVIIRDEKEIRKHMNYFKSSNIKLLD